MRIGTFIARAVEGIVTSLLSSLPPTFSTGVTAAGRTLTDFRLLLAQRSTSPIPTLPRPDHRRQCNAGFLTTLGGPSPRRSDMMGGGRDNAPLKWPLITVNLWQSRYAAIRPHHWQFNSASNEFLNHRRHLPARHSFCGDARSERAASFIVRVPHRAFNGDRAPRPGATIAKAQAQLNTIALHAVAVQYPDTNAHWKPGLLPPCPHLFWRVRSSGVDHSSADAWTLLAHRLRLTLPKSAPAHRRHSHVRASLRCAMRHSWSAQDAKYVARLCLPREPCLLRLTGGGAAIAHGSRRRRFCDGADCAFGPSTFPGLKDAGGMDASFLVSPWPQRRRWISLFAMAPVLADAHPAPDFGAEKRDGSGRRRAPTVNGRSILGGSRAQVALGRCFVN